MLKDKRIVFFVPGLDVFRGAVYYSQVFGLAQYLAQRGAACMIVGSSYEKEERFEEVVDGVRIVNCPYSKRYFPLPFQPVKTWLYSRLVRNVIIEFKPTHFYVRSIYAGLGVVGLARRCKAKLVFSRRGFEVAEVAASGRFIDYVKMRIDRFYACCLMRLSDHVNMVVSHLKPDTERFCKQTSVLPCCVMEEKFVRVPKEIQEECRKELSIPLDAKVVVYSGSLAHYQIPEVFLGLMKRMYDLDNKIVFLLMTEMLDELYAAASKVGLLKECYRVRKCTPQEVSKYLQCADVGIILRKNDLINRNASPVKLAEYLASGLGLIVSPWIGDAGKWLAEEPFAFLYTDDSDVEGVIAYVKGITDEKKSSAVACARRHYTYAGNNDSIEKMFA